MGRFLAPFIFALAVLSSPTLTRDVPSENSYAQSEYISEPYVQITSVTVEPSAIHKTQGPPTAIVVVQLMVRGQAPPHSEATVEAGTYSTDPPDNDLKYENPTRTVVLEKDITVVKFRVEGTAKTFQGKIRVAASLSAATKSIHIKPSDPEPLSAELAVIAP